MLTSGQRSLLALMIEAGIRPISVDDFIDCDLAGEPETAEYEAPDAGDVDAFLNKNKIGDGRVSENKTK